MTLTDHRSLTDEELREMFDSTIQCCRWVFQSPLSDEKIQCTAEAEYILVCKHCGVADFECGKCLFDRKMPKYGCLACSHYEDTISALMRLVGRL